MKVKSFRSAKSLVGSEVDVLSLVISILKNHKASKELVDELLLSLEDMFKDDACFREIRIIAYYKVSKCAECQKIRVTSPNIDEEVITSFDYCGIYRHITKNYSLSTFMRKLAEEKISFSDMLSILTVIYKEMISILIEEQTLQIESDCTTSIRRRYHYRKYKKFIIKLDDKLKVVEAE